MKASPGLFPAKRLAQRKDSLYQKHKRSSRPKDKKHFIITRHMVKAKIKQAYDRCLEDLLGISKPDRPKHLTHWRGRSIQIWGQKALLIPQNLTPGFSRYWSFSRPTYQHSLHIKHWQSKPYQQPPAVRFHHWDWTIFQKALYWMD